MQANPNSNLALPVLDQDTGQTLEHRQLRRHPKYKDVWDTSYADELGRLRGQQQTLPFLELGGLGRRNGTLYLT